MPASPSWLGRRLQARLFWGWTWHSEWLLVAAEPGIWRLEQGSGNRDQGTVGNVHRAFQTMQTSCGMGRAAFPTKILRKLRMTRIYVGNDHWAFRTKETLKKERNGQCPPALEAKRIGFPTKIPTQCTSCRKLRMTDVRSPYTGQPGIRDQGIVKKNIFLSAISYQL